MLFTLDLLFDLAWSYLGDDEIYKHFKGRSQYREPGASEIAKELFVLHVVMQAMQEALGPSMEVIRDMLESLKKDATPKPRKLSLPKSKYEVFRRDFIKGLFNAVRPKGADGSRIGLQLGEMLFSSADDAARIDDQDR